MRERLHREGEQQQLLSLRFFLMVLRRISSYSCTATCLTCVEANHVHVLVKMACVWYCQIRLNHIARRETDKIKDCKVVRRKLNNFLWRLKERWLVIFVCVCVSIYVCGWCTMCLSMCM